MNAPPEVLFRIMLRSLCHAAYPLGSGWSDVVGGFNAGHTTMHCPHPMHWDGLAICAYRNPAASETSSSTFLGHTILQAPQLMHDDSFGSKEQVRLFVLFDIMRL